MQRSNIWLHYFKFNVSWRPNMRGACFVLAMGVVRGFSGEKVQEGGLQFPPSARAIPLRGAGFVDLAEHVGAIAIEGAGNGNGV